MSASGDSLISIFLVIFYASLVILGSWRLQRSRP